MPRLEWKADMRLICPNCDAQYEVADDVIPDEGRDVQCSNCGNTWWQDSARTMRIAAGLPAEEEPAPVPEVEDTVPEPEPVTTTISDESAKILRDEAMRELKNRLAEKAPIETQDDLGLDNPPADPAPSPIPVPVPVPVPMAADPEPDPSPSRSKLPDIEEINSSLEAASARRAFTSDDYDDEPVERRNRGGFRLGFAAAVVVTLLGLAAYMFPAQIVSVYPDAAPMLASFIQGADSFRAGFNDWALGSIASLTDMMNSATSDG